ncbi:hypothetical protein EIKCOROL_02297 [Eikenella corrodens ATCC 23834]|uniref:Uncharacterized protein n=1 Tax=Eikenella corrodens ATCC 23834 TaxID=546274 RepID=C0DY35_EIKCO|nr:hypothetical protein EIKCOROL_02297 [Eikenella corrodens ATCC 23834]
MAWGCLKTGGLGFQVACKRGGRLPETRGDSGFVETAALATQNLSSALPRHCFQVAFGVYKTVLAGS